MGTKGKKPAMLFYPRDWLADPALNVCSLCAQGLWLRMLCYMWESEKRGYLIVNNKALHKGQICRLVGQNDPEDEVLHWMQELEDAGVYSIDEEGVIYSRRMVSDQGDTPNMKEAVSKKKDKKASPRARTCVEDEIYKEYNTKDGVKRAIKNKSLTYKDYAGFQKFWETYPPRNGVRQNKQESFISWVYDGLESSTASIVASVEKLKETADWKKEKGRYIPMAVTFLNHKRWEDEVEYSPSAWSGTVEEYA
jgi:hypothetical protein